LWFIISINDLQEEQALKIWLQDETKESARPHRKFEATTWKVDSWEMKHLLLVLLQVAALERGR
jgi:hypothetical protein